MKKSSPSVVFSFDICRDDFASIDIAKMIGFYVTVDTWTGIVFLNENSPRKPN